MGLFDLAMRIPDSYWKKKFHAEEIRRKSAEADARCVRGLMEEQEGHLDRMTRRDVGQSHAIEVLNRKVEELKASLEERTRCIDERDREIDALREALRAERDARQVMKTNGLLWEQLRRETVRDPSTAALRASAQDDTLRTPAGQKFVYGAADGVVRADCHTSAAALVRNDREEKM